MPTLNGHWYDARAGALPSHPAGDAQLAGHRWIQAQRRNEISDGLSLFADKQSLLSRSRSETFRRRHAGESGRPAADERMLTAADLLHAATLGGAANAGLVDRVGALTPGNLADVVLLDTRHPSLLGVSDAYAAVTAFATPAWSTRSWSAVACASWAASWSVWTSRPPARWSTYTGGRCSPPPASLNLDSPISDGAAPPFGAVAALPTLNGHWYDARAGALPSHPTGDAQLAGHR